ncbi:MAG: CbtB-domain containing protein [Oceanospirillaceae bacterium]|nr:CbtB-domain containing protein [Oceanospirillaceae bacterium]
MSAIFSSSAERRTRSGSKASSAFGQGAVMLFGVLVIYAVGFLPMSAAHNAAHDTRHSFVFPCH